MAQQIITRYTDDHDGKELTKEHLKTVEITFMGVQHRLDLSPKNVEKLEKQLADFGLGQSTKISGRRSGSNKNTTPATVDREQTKAIREWANNNGYTVSPRGRIPLDAMQAFEEAH